MATLRDWRESRVLSLEDLSKLTGIAVSTLSRLENGKQKPRFVTRRALAKALKVKPAEIDF